jgi:hypothetical protein
MDSISPTKPTAPPVVKKTVDIKKQTVIPVVKKATMGPGVVLSAPTPWVSGKPYPKNAQVSLDGLTFRSKKNHNMSTPSTSGADWVVTK